LPRGERATIEGDRQGGPADRRTRGRPPRPHGPATTEGRSPGFRRGRLSRQGPLKRHPFTIAPQRRLSRRLSGD